MSSLPVSSQTGRAPAGRVGPVSTVSMTWFSDRGSCEGVKYQGIDPLLLA
jgi:hypothetical protein